MKETDWKVGCFSGFSHCTVMTTSALMQSFILKCNDKQANEQSL